MIRSKVGPVHADDVLQDIREVLLVHADRYDPDRGDLGGFVFGVVRNVIRKSEQDLYRRAARQLDSDSRFSVDQLEQTTPLFDPIEALGENAAAEEWVRVASDAATDFEWAVVVALVETEGTSADVAKLLDASPSAVRMAVGRVAAIVRTTRAAIALRDDGLPVTLEASIPVEGGFAAMLPYRAASEVEGSKALGIAATSFRGRRSVLTRLAKIVHTIDAQRGLSPQREKCLSVR
ncbi:RNA polymerase sigma factor [Microbacterium amylolyticum]|uniref:DNA-directed RNA polymerase specialized sigma24 family protein n=1 Tax=Microbacterium amylolyticum TaxID=936337 RepID=A0ABS4ZLK6_9MICO|nr:sigma-70 family RNA polymerase sigma factor [Microbacterium amylolyticum]MBP2437898.1 DNA-directed RNA polymerase specialized sigma24 family protein [Microbacterium amylolyticum]